MLVRCDIPDDDPEFYEANMRQARNAFLSASDWTQLPDAPCDSSAWAAYRQALRDFPLTWTPGPTADFPEPPA